MVTAKSAGIWYPSDEGGGGFTCTTVLRTYRTGHMEGFSRSLPERVYRREKNGLVVESPTPPARVWMPGVNPSDARSWR